jgi:hypothetical protein
MKHRSIFLIPIFLLFSLVISSSCKKEKSPDYPELIGYWQGMTSQGNPVSFKIENKKGTLYITKYNLLVTFSGGAQTYEHTNTNGIVALSGRYFNLPLGSGSAGPAFIDGNFDYGATTVSLSGTFAVYYPSSSVDQVTGNYTAYRY